MALFDSLRTSTLRPRLPPPGTGTTVANPTIAQFGGTMPVTRAAQPGMQYAGGSATFDESRGGGSVGPMPGTKSGLQPGAITARPFPGGPTLPPMPPPPAPPSGGLTEFGPGNDLRSAQINPQASDALNRARTLGGQGLESLYTAPDRGQLAADQLKLLEEQSQPAFERALQDVGRRASALGRIGSGVTTSELGDVTATREKALAQARRGLATDAAGQTFQDRLSRLNATQGYTGDLTGQEAAARGELRGERGYQTDTAQQALENRVRQRLTEEDLLNSQFGRQTQRAQLGLTGAELYGQQAQQNLGTAGDLVGELAFQGAQAPRPSASPVYTPTTFRRSGKRARTEPV